MCSIEHLPMHHVNPTWKPTIFSTYTVHQTSENKIKKQRLSTNALFVLLYCANKTQISLSPTALQLNIKTETQISVRIGVRDNVRTHPN